MKHSLCAHKSLDAYNYVLCVEREVSLSGTEHLPSITLTTPPPPPPPPHGSAALHLCAQLQTLVYLKQIH